MSTALAPPSLQEATKSSTDTWHQHLELLFHEAKDRFPDVVWELVDDEDKQHVEAEVWGHKAMVYARAPPNFQTRYFNRGNPSSASILGASTFSFDIPDFPRTPSPMSAVLRSTSPAPSGQGASSLLRLTTTINPTLFSNELGYLYTGKGFGEAFEFLFDAADASGDSEMDAEEMRLDKLRKDLVYMWRSRLYSDVKISLTGVFSSSNHEATTAIFSVHRFILVSRCEYFHHVLVGWPNKPSSDTLTLPSPPFTPASLHFALGFIYTGTLIFSNRTYDLDTAFAILRSATYLSLQTLYDEIQARIVQEMMHGLFHAFLEFSEYESLTNGKWGTGGCRCRQCARRAPRVLQFAISDDVKNMHLDRGARRALVGLFGEGWVTSEFAELPQKIRDGLLKGVGKRTTPENAFALLYAAHHALTKLSNISAPWTNVVKEMILEGQKTISRLFCSNGHQCFAQEEWMEIMRNDGVGFADSEKVDWVMAAVQRGLSDRWAPMTYQTLVSDILLHPHPTEVNAAMLSQRSIVRVKVEAARMGVLKYIRQHWMNIRTAGGFDDLEGWAIKEISDSIEIPLEELLMPSSDKVFSRGSTNGHGRLTVRNAARDNDSISDAISVHSSMRVSVLSKHLPVKRGTTPTGSRHSSLASSSSSVASSVKSSVTARTAQSIAVRSTRSTVISTSRATNATKKTDGRPDSKLAPAPAIVRPSEGLSHQTSSRPSSRDSSYATPSRSSSPSRESGVSSRMSNSTPSGGNSPTPMDVDEPNKTGEQERRTTRKAPLPKKIVSRHSMASSVSTVSTATRTRKMSGSSVKSTTSVSTLRNNRAVLKPPVPSPRMTTRTVSSPSRASTTSTSTSSRPLSRVSTNSTSTAGTTTFRTAPSEAATVRSRTTSSTSTSRVLTPHLPRARRASASSVSSTRSTNRTPVKKSPVPPVPTLDAKSTRKAPSIASPTKSTPVKTIIPVAPRHRLLDKKTGDAASTPSIRKSSAKNAGKTSSSILVKALAKGSEHKKTDSAATDSTVVGSIKRRLSTETIKKSIFPTVPEPKGATLEIGIPCIITSKRKRFKAFARYIGEVEGEDGPWVGVEVPIPGGGDHWGSDSDSTSGTPDPASIPYDRQWHDGTWGGIRYFELGGHGGSDWDYYGDDSMSRAARRRRIDASGSSFLGKGARRDARRFRSSSPTGSDASYLESRGLFVRPQQVLYVVDAVGPDV